jgi:hypothetical protein
LEELIVNNNQASALPACIGNLANLKRLDLNSSSIQDFPESLKDLKKLSTIEGSLNMDENLPFGVFPRAKEKLISWFPKAKIQIWKAII